MVFACEDIIDRQIIAEYEAKEKNGAVTFVDSGEIVEMIKNQKGGPR